MRPRIDTALSLPPLAPRARQRHHLVLVGIRRLREGGVDDLAPGQDAFADRDIEILGRGAVELLQHRLERLLGEILALLAERLLHDGLAEIEVLGALLGADVAADAGARLAGDDKTLPGWRRRLRLRGDDLDLVAVDQLGAQRQQPPVDLGADAGVADLRMDGIGEIDRRRAARQGDHLALSG
jgi:hypothetical protein